MSLYLSFPTIHTVLNYLLTCPSPSIEFSLFKDYASVHLGHLQYNLTNVMPSTVCC